MKRRTVPASNHSGAAKAESSGAHHAAHGHHATQGGHRKVPVRKSPPAINLLSAPGFSPARIRFIYAAAILGDLAQVPLGAFGFPQACQWLSVALAVLLIPALGPHLLLFAALLLELVPNANVLPLWTACAALVIALRKGGSRGSES